MKLTWSNEAWIQYVSWQTDDRKVLRRINELIRDIIRTENDQQDAIGKPEPLRNDLAGWWSRRITHEHRLVYRLKGDTLEILSCRYHYEK